MTSRDFAFWLQGFLETANPKTINAKQLAVIRAHLALVFRHEIDPSMGPPAHQKILDTLHAGGVKPYPDSSNICVDLTADTASGDAPKQTLTATDLSRLVMRC